MSHQYGPIGVQAYPGAVGTQQNMALPLSTNKQVELMERLKQLRAWQQRQQADLLRQQQEQLLRLRSEQQTAIHDKGQESSLTGEGWSQIREGDGFDRLSSLPESPCSVSGSQDVCGPSGVDRVESGNDVNDQGEIFDSHDRENQGELGSGSDNEENTTSSRPLPQVSHRVFRGAHLTNEERPVQPVVGDFEQFLEQQLELDKSTSPGASPTDNPVDARQPRKFPFLRRGEGIARFGVKKIKLKSKQSSKSLPSSSDQKSPPKSSKSLPTLHSQKSPPKFRKSLSSSDDQCRGASADTGTDGQPPLLQSERQPKVRKVARGRSENGLSSSTKSLQPSYPRESTPTMFRCGSEDSFIIRRDARLQREEEELREFELLEMATVGDTPISSSSTSSLNQVPPTFDVPLSPHVTTHSPTSPCPTGMTFAPAAGLPLEMQLAEGELHNYDVDSNLRLLAYKNDPTVPEPTLQLPPKEDAPAVTSHLPWQHPPPPPEDTYEGHNDDRDDLDETLTGPSLMGEVDFNDEEEWHSFSQDSPAAGQVRDGLDFVDCEATNGSMLSVEVGASWSSPVRREKLNELGLPIFQSPFPSATLSSVATANPEIIRQQSHPFAGKYSTSHKPMTASASVSQTAPNVNKANSRIVVSASSEVKSSASSPPGSVENQVINSQQLSSVSYQQLPPPSALVAKLFPALKKDKRPQDLTAVNSKPPSKPTRARSPHIDKTPSPTSSAGGDSGKGSLAAGSSATSVMNEELRRKLCLLETEIERFKSENATLEKLRKEKEEGVAHLKKEIAEFKRQKEEEMTRFEEYKKEEIRKLKKERKMFETYQQQARTARDRKDKEDITALRNELQELHEDLRQRESRWGSAQSRLRLKIQSLEKENQELRSDLKMMEQTRLQLWQKQMEQELEHAKRKKERCSVTPDLELPQDLGSGAVSDGYQSDGEGSDISTRAEEIAEQVLADNQVDSQARRRTPSAELKDHFPSDSSEHTSATSGVEEDVHTKKKVGTSGIDESRKKATSKRVCFSSSPKRKPKPVSSPSKNVSEGTKQQRVSPRKKAKAPLSPLKTGGEGGRAKRERSRSHSDGTSESSQEDGSRVILFPNGTRKIISPDGKSTSVYFFNGDVKHVKPDQTVVYFYAESKTTHTTYADGLEVFSFPNGQCEKHFPNGTKEITFPDQTLKYVHPSGEEETHFPDGTLQKVLPDGDMTLFYANGQKEIYTKEFKRREYPDGTVKTVYPDGRQETRYASGRVRVKDKEGRTLFDKLPDT